MAAPWKDRSPTFSELDLGVIVLQVIGRKPDGWIVASSHGDPSANGTIEFPTKETAQTFAVRFAGTEIQKTLAKLAELESSREAPAIGYKARNVHLVTLQIEPHPSFADEDGAARPDVFEQRRSQLIADQRKTLRDLLAQIGQ